MLTWLQSPAGSRSFGDPVVSSLASAHSTPSVIHRFTFIRTNRSSVVSAVVLAVMFLLLLCRASGCDFRRALEIVSEFSKGVARDSAPRSGARFGASEGAAPQAAGRPVIYSQSSQHARAHILAQLAATTRRLAAIDTTNRAASEALATACESERGSPFT
jgi:hypothetical protein